MYFRQAGQVVSRQYIFFPVQPAIDCAPNLNRYDIKDRVIWKRRMEWHEETNFQAVKQTTRMPCLSCQHAPSGWYSRRSRRNAMQFNSAYLPGVKFLNNQVRSHDQCKISQRLHSRELNKKHQKTTAKHPVKKTGFSFGDDIR